MGNAITGMGNAIKVTDRPMKGMGNAVGMGNAIKGTNDAVSNSRIHGFYVPSSGRRA